MRSRVARGIADREIETGFSGDAVLAEDKSGPGTQRPFVGIHLKCCNTYIRAYAIRDGSAFVGWCPRCAAQVRIPIVKQGGSTSRFFEAS